MSKKYQHLALGGTFDRLHKGHKSLLDYAFKISQRVSIGIVGTYHDAPLHRREKILHQIIEPYEARKNAVKNYLKSKNWLSRSIISPIDDIYGNTLKNTTLEAILVTKNTYPNALRINLKRKKNKLKPLKIVITPLIKGKDHKIISSERIRLGEIDQQGYSYLKVLSDKQKLRLPENLREKLRLPIGKVIKGTEKTLLNTAEKVKKLILHLKPTLIVSVGDIVTSSLIEAGLYPDIQIIDFKSRRKHLQNMHLTNYYRSHHNNPGTLNYRIAKLFIKTVKKFYEKNQSQQIIIRGEEDLIALISILLSPLDSVVVYGHYDLGVIIVDVTENKKREIEKILSQFN